MDDRHGKLPSGQRLGSVWILALALAAFMPATPESGAAWAQADGGHDDGGHDDGGHEDGGHEDGGHEDGGGKGKGGKHGKPQPPARLPLTRPGEGDANPAAYGRAAGVGSYLRLELGAAKGKAKDASWLPPGYPNDPQVFFDLDVDSAAMAGIAAGYGYGNGWRAEVALNAFASANFGGPWTYTQPATEGPHASVEGSVRSIALMANGYYDFATGGKATPFVTAGIGLAHNTLSDWTRINPDSDRSRRSFEGGSDTGLAWSVGAGVAVDVGPVLGSAPAKLELTWRYFDLGSVSGGSTPLPGSGSGGNPVKPLNFDVTDQVISVGLRIPL
jgi:opacity protein-like surface antigen